MKNIYLFQPQHSVTIANEDMYWLPYSSGCIWSYAYQFKEIKENFILKDIIYARENQTDVLNRMENPVLCGFSTYIWNERYNLKMAKIIKEKFPNCKIIFGGAQASGKYLNHQYIDSIVMAEGEENFLEILQDVLHNKNLKTFYDKKRLNDLTIPSPYLTGVFDKIIKDNPKALWSFTFETNRGCPFSCTFCDWGGVTYSKVKKFDIKKIRKELEWVIDKPVGYIICADANFGIFKERDLEIAKILREVADKSQVESINLQYAKNSTELVFEIGKIIGPYSKGITISVQSMNQPTLEAIKRTNLEINDVKNLMKLSEQYDIITYTELILGMPLETLESWKEGYCQILEMGQHQNIEQWFGQCLENSELNTLNSKMKYGIKTVEATFANYMPLHVPNEKEEEDVEEIINLITSTNTMSQEEFVEAYLYGWMIIQFHIAGYSQIFARYLREKHNVSYRSFYDKFFTKLKNSFLRNQFDILKEATIYYLQFGKIPKTEDTHLKKVQGSGHSLHFQATSFEFLFENKSKIFDFGKEVAEEFNEIPNYIYDLQKYFIYDPMVSYPVIINSDFALNEIYDTKKPIQVKPRSLLTTKSIGWNLYRFRRLGLLKNRVMVV